MILVLMAVEMLGPKDFGRIRRRRNANGAAVCAVPFVQEVIELGAQVRADCFEPPFTHAVLHAALERRHGDTQANGLVGSD